MTGPNKLTAPFAQRQKNGRIKQLDMKPRDAMISFRCVPPDSVQVSEMIGGDSIQHQETRRHPDVVTAMETKYIFFAKQANIARRLVMHGQSCMVNVYFREP